MTVPMLNDSERLELATEQALTAAEAARRAREEFLARMSHELRTPLNAVIGFSRVMESNRAGNQRPEDIEMLRRMRAGGEQLLRLIENVLDQSSVAQGTTGVELSDVDVVSATDRVVDRYRDAASARDVRLVAVLPSMTPTVRLDLRRFEQVLDNLMDNAVKFTSYGSIRVVLVTDAASGRPLRITVTDTGIGIPEERIESIFQPFVQVDTSHKRSYGGPGLGLPLARRFCHAMGCELLAQSQLGVGSRFTIRFPGLS